MGTNIPNCNCYGINLASKLHISKKRVLQYFILPCFLPLHVLWSKPRSSETLGFLSNDEIRVSVSRLFLKCIWSDIFLLKFTVQWVNKSIVNFKVLQNKHNWRFWRWTLLNVYQKMATRLGRVCCIISSCDAVLWTELITKKSFWGETTCRAILNWVLSLNL